ncbi:recombinase family protein [Pseudomonas viridiflava]|uniref:recombinase family protein n=2 Tax=Pseudomonas viridiflava TaxID=33069 RepID=UPI000F0666B8
MKRVAFKVATMPNADTMQLHLFAVLAEQERAFISQRTKDALKALQQRADDGCGCFRQMLNVAQITPQWLGQPRR